MIFLISAVGLFTFVFMGRSLFPFPSRKERNLMEGWILTIFLIVIYHLLLASMGFLPKSLHSLCIKKVIEFSGYVDVAFSFFAFLLFFLTLFVLSRRDPVFKWLLFTAVFTTLSYLISVCWDPMPSLVFRYSGVFDLPMLFGWLMIIHTLILERFQIER